MRLAAALLRSRAVAALLLVLAVVGAGAAVLPPAPDPAPPSSRTGLGEQVESVRVERAQQAFPDAGTQTALVVWEREGGGALTASAGLLLAAVFAGLGVLPLITLTQLGIIVCLGVLLDTLLVRAVVVPALAFLLGETFWWPGRPHRSPGAEGRVAG